MKAEKRISIKVKSKTERRIMEDPTVEMITEWNIKRIIYALIVLILLVILPAYYFSTQDDSVDIQNKTHTATQAEFDLKKQESIKPKHSKQSIAPVSSKETITKDTVALSLPIHSAVPEQTHKTKNPEIVVAKESEQQLLLKLTETKYLNKNITRAQLAQGVEKLEPYGQVYLPLLVNKTNAEGLFFFTEVNNMQGRTVFHEWLKQGKTKYKHKFVMRKNKGIAYTSKLFSYSSAGQWQVRIITQQGEVLHKIDFSVQQQ